eukprot:5738263-Amphidinium_carterae.1
MNSTSLAGCGHHICYPCGWLDCCTRPFAPVACECWSDPDCIDFHPFDPRQLCDHVLRPHHVAGSCTELSSSTHDRGIVGLAGLAIEQWKLRKCVKQPVPSCSLLSCQLEVKQC